MLNLIIFLSSNNGPPMDIFVCMWTNSHHMQIKMIIWYKMLNLLLCIDVCFHHFLLIQTQAYQITPKQWTRIRLWPQWLFLSKTSVGLDWIGLIRSRLRFLMNQKNIILVSLKPNRSQQSQNNLIKPNVTRLLYSKSGRAKS